MLCRDGSVRIMDFGIAVGVAGRRMTIAGLSGPIGTPHYMAPEQVEGKRGDARTDTYSLGAVLYEATTGHQPYDEQPDMYSVMNARLVGDPVPPRTHNPAIMPAVEEIILHALERDPKDRYQTATDMKHDLEDPDRVEVSGRAARRVVPTLAKRQWRIVGTVAAALAVPVVLFFLILFVLSR
jgi:serine/threonine-protein kinase